MDRPKENADRSSDISFGSKSPEADGNWIATDPDRGFFKICFPCKRGPHKIEGYFNSGPSTVYHASNWSVSKPISISEVGDEGHYR
jgi:hypothetical protein